MPANDTIFRLLEPLRLRLLDSPLRGWLREAGAAVRDLLPAKWRRLLSTQERAIWLDRDAAGLLRVRACNDGRAALIGSLPPDPELLDELQHRLQGQAAAVPRWWLLAPEQVLTRSLTLPASSEPRLRDVLLHEIDRQTPFTAEQVHFEARVQARDVARRQIRVELTVVPRARIESELAGLGALAEGLAGVDVAADDGARRGVNLLPSAQRGVRADRARRWNLLLAAGAAATLLFAMWLMLANRAGALAAMQSRVDAANGDVRAVRKLANALHSAQAAANFLSAQRAQRPTQLELLADLTRRLPDTTSLEKLSVNGDHIVLIGQSQQAAALVGLLQGSTLLKTPALAGAVQTDPRTGRERFTLTANLAGASEGANGRNPTP